MYICKLSDYSALIALKPLANLPHLMKKIFTLLAFVFFAFGCDKKSKVEQAVEEIPVSVQVERFDKAFFEAKPQDLPKLKAEYPLFFPKGNDDKVWTDKMQNPQWRELYQEVQKKFGNFEKETEGIDALFKHIKYYFPATKVPKVVTVIAEMDYQNKVIYADSVMIVSLELYLGKDHRFYQFPDYLKQNFEPEQILPDIASAFSVGKIAPPQENTLLSYMVYAGKELYLKDMLLPDYTDAQKIGYKPEQIKWCEENQADMWRFFIDNTLLYDTDQKLLPRFINPAPFSKFYLEIDNESPGQVGAWLGWQIVRAYMRNNEVSLEQMLQTDSKTLFEQSKYKPKKP
ncbi:gliding motility-associated lipoprotein GldB [Flavobacterium caeni]|uniref:Gliding motility-associated lipoprotein GldB n=2 Tax=Flavobacterium caeni TaxID=490189 RepID=A0A1G5I616_9FLAO|nr:gliding motility-associated lipoprotein GldB [Flavobacterium caeni]